MNIGQSSKPALFAILFLVSCFALARTAQADDPTPPAADTAAPSSKNAGAELNNLIAQAYASGGDSATLDRAYEAAKRAGDPRADMLKRLRDGFAVPQQSISKTVMLSDLAVLAGQWDNALARAHAAQNQIDADADENTHKSLTERIQILENAKTGQAKPIQTVLALAKVDAASQRNSTAKGYLHWAKLLANEDGERDSIRRISKGIEGLSNDMGWNWEEVKKSLYQFNVRLHAGYDYASYSAGYSDKDIQLSSGITRHRLKYNIHPIHMLDLHGEVELFRGLTSSLGLAGFTYKTDRMFRSGGETQSYTSLSQELGLGGKYSDLLTGLLQISGATIQGTYAKFTTGSIELQELSNTSTVRALGMAPAQVEYVKIDAGWDFVTYFYDNKTDAAAHMFLGLRYNRLMAPRILYQVDENQSGSKQRTLVSESEPQIVTYKTLSVGGNVGLRWRRPGGSFGFLLDLGMFFGGGTMSPGKPTLNLISASTAGQPNALPLFQPGSCNIIWGNFSGGLGVSYRIVEEKDKWALSLVAKGSLDWMMDTGVCSKSRKETTPGTQTAVDVDRTTETLMGNLFLFGQGLVDMQF